LLPKDFDRRFFNAASPGLVAPAYLRGDEQVVVSGVSPSGGFVFKLPVSEPPRVDVEQADRDDVSVKTNLDTVIVDTDARKLLLLWRAQVPVREPTTVRTIKIAAAAGTPQRAVA